MTVAIFTDDEKHALYDLAIQKWGEDFQKIMAVEEMAELTQVLIHSMRKNKTVTYAQVADEIADVRIMLEQMITLFSITDLVEEATQRKLGKLKNYLEVLQ
jgi:hypothetical protein